MHNVNKLETEGFGVPVRGEDYRPHQFIVRFIEGDKVDLIQDLGEHSGATIHRSRISQKVFTKSIAGALQREFNKRLKADGLVKNTSYRWRTTKDNPLYNLLGKELAVLFWTLEQVDGVEEAEDALRGWLRLDPTERWALFGRIAGTPGGRVNEDTGEPVEPKGWKRGVYHGLTDV